MADPIPVDQDGNPVFPPLEELQSLLEQEGIDQTDLLNPPVFYDGDGTENNGDSPRIRVL